MLSFARLRKLANVLCCGKAARSLGAVELVRHDSLHCTSERMRAACMLVPGASNNVPLAGELTAEEGRHCTRQTRGPSTDEARVLPGLTPSPAENPSRQLAWPGHFFLTLRTYKTR